MMTVRLFMAMADPFRSLSNKLRVAGIRAYRFEASLGSLWISWMCQLWTIVARLQLAGIVTSGGINVSFFGCASD